VVSRGRAVLTAALVVAVAAVDATAAPITTADGVAPVRAARVAERFGRTADPLGHWYGGSGSAVAERFGRTADPLGHWYGGSGSAVAERSADAALAAVGLDRVTREPDTGVVALAWGAGVAAPGASADADAAARAARDLIAAHLDALAPGAAPDDLALVTNAASALDGLRVVGFAQRAGGLAVVGGRVDVVVAHDRIVVVLSAALPHAPRAVPAARVSADAARRSAVRWLGAGAVAGAAGDAVVLPLVRDGGAPVEYRVVRAVRVTGAGVWDVYVDARTGEPIARADRALHAAGAIAYDVPIRFPGAERAAHPAALATHVVDGAALTADADGRVTWPGAAAATVAPGLAGPRVRIRSAGGVATTELDLAPGGAAIWSAAGDPAADAQLAAFVHAGVAKAFVAAHLLPDLAWLDRPLDVYVNEAGACNAYSTGDDLHFFAASSSCENTARLADVVYHELGHSVHAQANPAGIDGIDVAVSEALADFLAASIVGDPAVGRGMFYTDAPIRHLDPGVRELVYPDHARGDPHRAGLVLAQALWDLRTALVAAEGSAAGVALAERIVARLFVSATDLTSAYALALAVDDDDGDLANGTPHRCAIAAAFGVHGLAGGDLAPPALVAAATDGLAVSIDVAAPAAPPGCPAPTMTAAVRWGEKGGATAELAMTAGATTGDVTRWSATVPTPPGGTVIAYELVASVRYGDVAVGWSAPDNAADPRYEVYVGPVEPLWCDDFEGADAGWTHGADPPEFDRWAIGAPTGAGLDPEAAFAGERALGLGLAGDGRYVPATVQWARSPVIDVTGAPDARLQYRRWLTVEDGRFDAATIRVDGDERWRNAVGGGELPHLDRAWRFHDVALGAAAADGAVQLELAIAADVGVEYGGWTVDDVCVVAPVEAGSEPGGGCAASHGASPLAILGALVLVARTRGHRPASDGRDRIP
jgi:hypothetical protein